MYDVEEFDKAKTKVLKYVLYKKRTEKEIRQKFEDTIEENMLEDIIEFLEDNNYINDRIYVERAIKEFMALKTLSLKEVRYKLCSKGVKNDIIDAYFKINSEKLQEYELKSARNVVFKKKATMEPREILHYMLKKGYHLDNAKQALEDFRLL